jgi:hypothetical protein
VDHSVRTRKPQRMAAECKIAEKTDEIDGLFGFWPAAPHRAAHPAP